MSKVFKSSSFLIEFTGTRAEAIKAAELYLVTLIRDKALTERNRYTWRCDKQSGFTIEVTPKENQVVRCVSKWNSYRN